MQAVTILPTPTEETLHTLKQLCNVCDLAQHMAETGGLASVAFAGQMHHRAQKLAETLGHKLVLSERDGEEEDVLEQCSHRPRYVAVKVVEEPEDERARRQRGQTVREWCTSLARDVSGQTISEYAVMLAVILVVVVGTVKLIGSNAQTVFSTVASSIQ